MEIIAFFTRCKDLLAIEFVTRGQIQFGDDRAFFFQINPGSSEGDFSYLVSDVWTNFSSVT